MNPKVTIRGRVEYVLRGPDGRFKARGVSHNLVTDVGDIYFAEAVLGTAAAPPAGMKLGTEGGVAAAKNGAGSFIPAGDYVDGSNKAFDVTWPKAGGAGNIVQYKRIYAAGEATNATLNRVSIVDNTTNAGEADASHTSAIALLDPKPVNKGASDTLTITWNITFLGA